MIKENLKKSRDNQENQENLKISLKSPAARHALLPTNVDFPVSPFVRSDIQLNESIGQSSSLSAKNYSAGLTQDERRLFIFYLKLF